MNNKKYAQRLRAIAFCALFPYRLRTKVLRFTGCSVGHGSGIESGSYFGDAVISIGKHVYINTKVIIGNGGEVVIEDYVRIGPGTVIMAATHDMQNSILRRDPRNDIHKKTTIGRGCWIGAGVIIGAGVTVGEGCVIGAGAVLLSSTDKNALYVGVPARKVKDLPVDIEVEYSILSFFGENN
jgi:maltose O-acetyltransferase